MGLKKTIVVKNTLNCNLRCKYCYEFNRNEHEELNLNKFDSDNLCNMIERFAKIFEDSEILWMLHGGEPLLLNKKSFEKICKTIDNVNSKYKVNYKLALQTNATLIDEEWIDIFKKYIHLFSERVISISIDGPEEINDITRLDALGNGTHSKIVKSIKSIRRAGLDVTTISVVGSHNVGKIKEVYEFIKYIQPNFAKFIPCYNIDNYGVVEKFGITPLQYAGAMCELFDLWIRDIGELKEKSPLLAIDPVVTIIASITNSFITWCEYTQNKCDNFFTVFPNGDLWLCDTFQQDIHKEYGYVGNYFECNDNEIKAIISDINKHCNFNGFSSLMLEKCANCEISSICNGGCIAVRDSILKKSETLFNQYCIGKRKTILHIKEAIESAMSKC